MKSLVEEASSIAKAIEKAWERAGKPQAFSVKIYEVGEKNFFGFTKKSAKVGIFFEEEQPRSNERRPHGQNNRPQRAPHNNSYADKLERGAEKSERPSRNTAPEAHQSSRSAQPSRPSRPVVEERQETEQAPREETRQEPRERYVREGREDRPRRDNRRSGGRPERRGDDGRSQRSSQPLVQPYPHSENTDSVPFSDTPTPNHAVEQAQDRPVMGIPVAQTQRKVLKVSSRRYTGNKPSAAEEPKKSE